MADTERLLPGQFPLEKCWLKMDELSHQPPDVQGKARDQPAAMGVDWLTDLFRCICFTVLQTLHLNPEKKKGFW